MDLASRLVAAFQEQPDALLSAEELQQLPGTPAHEQNAIEQLLSEDYRFVEITPGQYRLAASLINGTLFFSIPETEDMEQGRLLVVGGELILLLQPAIRHGTGLFLSGEDEFRVVFKIENSDFFYFGGLQQWYKDTDFKAGQDVALITVLDYENRKYAISKISEEQFTDMMEDGLREKISNHVVNLVENYPEDLADLSGERFSTGRMLAFLLHQRVFDFHAYPCNISFYLSMEDRLLVNGNFLQVPDEDLDDVYSEHYMGGSVEMAMEEEDIFQLDEALQLMFDQQKPKEAGTLLKQLKIKYPEEKLMHKFLYQAAYFLEDDEEVLKNAKEYAQAFPRDPDPYRTMGEVYFKQDKLEQAEASFDQSLRRVHPEDRLFRSDILTIWMYLKLDQGDLEQALSLGREALKADPENEEVLDFFRENGIEPLSDEESHPPGKVINVDFKKSKQSKKDTP